MIAQEVEEILPEIVSTNVNGIKTLDYSKVSALLIEVVKEQQSSINRLQNQIQYLNEKIKNLDDLNNQNMRLSDEIDEIKIMMKYLNTQLSGKKGIRRLSTIDK